MNYEEELSALKSEWVDLYGVENVFTTNELTAKFNIGCFLAPFCYGKDRATGDQVKFIFNPSPRLYRLV